MLFKMAERFSFIYIISVWCECDTILTVLVDILPRSSLDKLVCGTNSLSKTIVSRKELRTH